MNVILLSGGSGTRLWPLSNEIRSKQFIKVFKDEQGQYESMVQRIYRQLRKAAPDANITIATARSQRSILKNQLGDAIDICTEPCRRDTFPAIVLAAAYLKDVKHISPDAPVVVCPVDPYVEPEYFDSLTRLSDYVAQKEKGLVLMGIEPSYPSEKYGYIIPERDAPYSPVKEFKEKPSLEQAKAFIRQGAVWNAGVFAFQLQYLMNIAHEQIDFIDYYDLLEKYDELDKISFDYAVVEKETDIDVLRYAGTWKDLGTWNTLTEAMEENTTGKVVLNDTCENTHVINELNIPVLGMGLRDLVVAASPEGIIVSDKPQSSYIKPYVEDIRQQVMFAEKSWGSFRVMDLGNESMTIKVTLNAGHQMNYHSHEYRDEIWTVVSGTGRTIVDGMEQNVRPGTVVTIDAGCRHTVIADTDLEIIEVQLGSDISVNDKKVYRLEL